MEYYNCDFYVIIFCGLSVAFTYDDLSFKKVTSQSSTWPGTYTYYQAKNAVDRDITTCIRPLNIGLNSPCKTVWWKVDLGGVYSIYSVNILFKNYDGLDKRQRGRFAGFSLYVSTTDISSTSDVKNSRLCYKDGPEIPPLNFTTICTEHGRYMIFYNERLDEMYYPIGYELDNVFSELCEVIVRGCNGSVYGSNCDIPCPINCKYSSCHIQSGTCFGCKPGWTGTACNIKCMKSWYGVNCSRPCVGHCRDGATCNHVTGLCDGGCDTGWTGTFCDNECADSTYGYACVNNCSGHCLIDSPCNKQTGHCDRGCNPGYTNSDCSRECSSGYFGLDCRNKCSGNCVNNEGCNHVRGFCPRGCIDGYIGRHCNISCQHGYYGKNCSLVCSPSCKTCRHTDGTCMCSCKAGWMGQNCSIDSLRNVETNADTDVASCTLWIVAFSISLVIHIIFISASLISRRNIFFKQKSTIEKVNFSRQPGLNTKPTLSTDTAFRYQVTSDDASNYQELRVSKDENTYQTLH